MELCLNDSFIKLCLIKDTSKTRQNRVIRRDFEKVILCFITTVRKTDFNHI